MSRLFEILDGNITVSIAGTAGRGPDGDKLSFDLYQQMEDIVFDLIQGIRKDREVILISGGAAWSDHLAVSLYLKGVFPNLILHLPCEWKDGSFFDNGKSKNVGSISNFYHKKFSEKLKIFNSLSEIDTAIKSKNCTTTVSKGFHARNELMAKSEVLIALTFGNKQIVNDGGTSHTCKEYIKNCVDKREDKSYHIDLNETPLKCYKGVQFSRNLY